MNVSKAIVKPLDEILLYSNKDVVDRFLKHFDVEREEAEFIFSETLKWLWLCGKSFEDGNKYVYVNTDMSIIDEMWHTFLLFTIEYRDFCFEYFNTFIHHIPITKSEIPEILKTEEEKIEFLKTKEDVFFKYVIDNLGHETANLWFLEMPQKYSKEKINLLYKGICV